jgi:hypothetical protein
VPAIHHELTRGKEKAAGNKLRTAENSYDAAAIVSREYERPGLTYQVINHFSRVIADVDLGLFAINPNLVAVLSRRKSFNFEP